MFCHYHYCICSCPLSFMASCAVLILVIFRQASHQQSQLENVIKILIKNSFTMCIYCLQQQNCILNNQPWHTQQPNLISGAKWSLKVICSYLRNILEDILLCSIANRNTSSFNLHFTDSHFLSNFRGHATGAEPLKFLTQQKVKGVNTKAEADTDRVPCPHTGGMLLWFELSDALQRSSEHELSEDTHNLSLLLRCPCSL